MIEQYSFNEVKKSYEKLLTILNGIDVYVCGGIVPYLLLGEDSNRLHHDIDCIVAMDDMKEIRNVLSKTDYYVENDDSLFLLKGNDDFGLEIKINGISIGLYPYKVNDNKIIQYSFNADNRRFKIKILNDNKNNYLKKYKSPAGIKYKTISLEYLRKSKELASRDKDLEDIKAIDRYGYDMLLYNHIIIPNPVNYLNKSLDEIQKEYNNTFNC